MLELKDIINSSSAKCKSRLETAEELVKDKD